MKKILLLVVLLLIVGGVVALYHYFPPETSADDKDSIIAFNTMPFERGTLYKTVSGTGTAQPREVVLISTDRPGTVVDIKKDFGDKVREGEELLRLDDRLAQRQLEQARQGVQTAAATVETAESDLAYRKKTEELARLDYDEYKKEGYSPTQRKAKELAWEGAKHAVKTAELAVELARKRRAEAEQTVETARLNVDLTHIRMPYIDRQSLWAEAGMVRFDPPPGRLPREFTIIDRKVSLNQTVGPPSATVLFAATSNPEEVEILAQINEGDIADVRVKQTAIYSVSALPDSYFKGTVTEIRPLPISGQGGVSYVAVIRGPNQPIPDPTRPADRQPGPGSLRAGMTTSSLDILVDSYATVKDTDGKEVVPWLVPNAALDYPGLDEPYLPRGVNKKYRDTPEDWKKEYVDGPKQEDAPVPRVIWLCDPRYDSDEKVRKKGSEATHPVQVLVGRTGKFWDENRPRLGLEDYTQILKTYTQGQEALPPSALVDEKGTPFKAVISDKKPSHKPGWFRLPDLSKVAKY